MFTTANNRPTMSLRFAFPAILGAVVALCSAPAAAQTDATRWAVVVLASDPSPLAHGREAADLASAALAASGGQVVASEAARFSLDEYSGSMLRPAPPSLVSGLDRAVTDAISEVASGNATGAIAGAEPVLTESEPFVSALGRVDESAAQLANLCLVVARARLEHREERAAEIQVQTCLRLVPDVVPNPHVHPPEVRALVGGVRTALAAGEGATLSVQVASDSGNCQVRLNGRPMGPTPWSSAPLVPGAYQVQVECDDRPGRVQRVELSAGEAETLRVTPRLASALDTRSGAPALVYAAASDPDGDTVRADLSTLARALHVTRVLGVVATDHGILLRAFAVDDGPLARGIGTAVVPEPMSEATSRRAVATVVDAGDSSASSGVDSRPGDIVVPVVGGVIAALGLGTLGASWYLWTEVDARGQGLTRVGTAAQLAPAQRAFDDATMLVPITGAIGSLALTISLPMFLPDEHRDVPWWSLVIGAAGLGVSVVGIYFVATEGDCYGNSLAPCSRRSPTWALGTLVLEHAAPLLAVPLTYIVRALLPTSSVGSASLRIDAGGGELSISGSF
jgi:hypothetical protein